jgi:hypothetical protein
LFIPVFGDEYSVRRYLVTYISSVPFNFLSLSQYHINAKTPVEAMKCRKWAENVDFVQPWLKDLSIK